MHYCGILGMRCGGGSTDHTLDQLAARWIGHIAVNIVFWVFLMIGLGLVSQRLLALLPRRDS